MFESPTNFKERFAGAVDLVVDIVTLGEYGLEVTTQGAETKPCVGGRCETDGRTAAWEALATPRRGSCPTASVAATARPRG